MSVSAPYSVGSPISSWTLIDWLDRTFTSVTRSPAGAVGGVLTVECEQLDPDELWLVDHMVASCTSSTDTVMRLYRDDTNPGNLRDGTQTGNFDVADWPGGLLVRPQSGLVAQWTGCSAGATATLTIQARQFRQRTS